MNNNLVKYVVATTNLYGLIHKNKVLKIYNLQNKDKKTSFEIDEIYSKSNELLDNFYIYAFGDYFIHQAIQGPERIQELISQKGLKPYYIPSKSELLKYINEDHFEQIPEFIILLDYLTTLISYDISKEQIKNVCAEIYYSQFFELEIYRAFELLDTINIDLNDKQINKFLKLVLNLSNAIRTWGNNGFTKNEIIEMFKNETKVN